VIVITAAVAAAATGIVREGVLISGHAVATRAARCSGPGAAAAAVGGCAALITVAAAVGAVVEAIPVPAGRCMGAVARRLLALPVNIVFLTILDQPVVVVAGVIAVAAAAACCAPVPLCAALSS
jgi:hypothetical protein